jgi:L-arabinokinase
VKIAYYISAHGYGHAARQQAVIDRLAQQGGRVYVRSAAPAKFFTAAVACHPERYDVGMVNPGTLEVDAAATFAAYADLITRQPAIIAREAAWLQAEQIDLVAVDMPPLACACAAAAGVPAVVVTHFTWDRVYRHYSDDFPQYRYVLEQIRADYGRATLALQIQLPLPHEFDMFPVVEPVPGLANPLTQSRGQVRAAFHIPPQHRLALLSMGGNDWGRTDIRALAGLPGWSFLVMPSAYEQVRGLPHVQPVPMDYPHYHNLIAAADVLVGKAGGSTVAEVIAHRTAMIYTLNDNWFENELLAATLERYCNSRYLPRADFERGDWVAALDEIVTRPYAWPPVAMNGAEVIAGRLLALARQHADRRAGTDRA